MRSKRLILFSFLASLLAGISLNHSSAQASLVESVTFNKQVVRILQQHCQACHHDGYIAPFSLVTYDQARLFADAIQEATESRQMPPWKASPQCSAFDGDRRLSDEGIETIAHWVEEGKPEGDPADLPPPLQFNNDWQLGQP